MTPIQEWPASPCRTPFFPIDTAPTTRPVLLWNAMTGVYIGKKTGGQWPMLGWDGTPGVWYPRPTLWAELPQPSEAERGRTWNEADHAGAMANAPQRLDYPGSDFDLMRDVYMTDAQRRAFNRLLGLERRRDDEVIYLTIEEVLSGHDRVDWAEGLISQMGTLHEGRNSWLLNYGRGAEAQAMRAARAMDAGR